MDSHSVYWAIVLTFISVESHATCTSLSLQLFLWLLLDALAPFFFGTFVACVGYRQYSFLNWLYHVFHSLIKHPHITVDTVTIFTYGLNLLGVHVRQWSGRGWTALLLILLTRHVPQLFLKHRGWGQWSHGKTCTLVIVTGCGMSLELSSLHLP